MNGFDWAGLGQALVVDVGESRGHASIAIAEIAPELKFVVQDLPKIVSEGREALPENMKGRISFLAHDFFTPQPIQASVCFLRFILHDSRQIRGAPASKSPFCHERGPRLLIADQVLPAPGVAPPTEERMMRTFDLYVTMMMNAHERESAEWRNCLPRRIRGPG